MPKCALPDHLKNKKHNDWIWPLSYIDRGVNAKGPRCSGKGYLSWPPKLVDGYGVSRWINNFSKSIVHIPIFDKAHIRGEDIYGKTFTAYEETTGKVLHVKLKWRELSMDDINNGSQIYSPSALQKQSQKGYMRLSPYYYAKWKFLDNNVFRKLTGTEKVLFYRYGWRPDHLNLYYNYGPFLGLNWE